MNGKYLLDTNIVIALFANDADVQTKLSAAREVLIPNTVFGELYYGAHKSGRAEANIQRVNELLASSAVWIVTVKRLSIMPPSKIVLGSKASQFQKMIFG
jgi:predicted nucleic acid-binding protein